jgi:hypothetical protein
MDEDKQSVADSDTLRESHRVHVMAPRPCFVDTMRPITPAETEAWHFYLNLHRDAWGPARTMFRAVCSQAASPSEALLAFVSATGLTSGAAERLEGLLQALAEDAGR